MNNPLATSARIVAEIREKLKAEFGLKDGEDALEDSLEGVSDLPELLARMARQSVYEEAQAEAIDPIIEALGARKARRERKAKTLRAQIAWALQEAGWKRIPDSVAPDMTVSVREGKAPLVIPNDDAVPMELCEFVRRPKKAEIRGRLDGGELFDFAYLGNPMPVLTIRVK